jgi:hypothetical protein
LKLIPTVEHQHSARVAVARTHARASGVHRTGDKRHATSLTARVFTRLERTMDVVSRHDR